MKALSKEIISHWEKFVVEEYARLNEESEEDDVEADDHEIDVEG